MNEKELEIAENIKGMLSKNLRIPEEEFHCLVMELDLILLIPWRLSLVSILLTA